MTMMSLPPPQPRLQPNPLFSHPTQPIHQRTTSQTQIILPRISQIATRLQCISNYKLRLESSRNDPRLSKLLGHISIYDSVREHRKEQMKQTAYPPPQQSYTQVRTPQPRQPVQVPQSKSTNELQEYLDLQQARVPCFQDFQAAIEMQIASLSEIQSTSKKLQALSQSCPILEEGNEKDVHVEVEEYFDGDSDSDSVSDYDSYDGEGDWRDDEDDDSEDSMTDPESVRSECSSPVEEKGDGGAYFDIVHFTSIKAGVGVSVNF